MPSHPSRRVWRLRPGCDGSFPVRRRGAGTPAPEMCRCVSCGQTWSTNRGGARDERECERISVAAPPRSVGRAQRGSAVSGDEWGRGPAGPPRRGGPLRPPRRTGAAPPPWPAGTTRPLRNPPAAQPPRNPPRQSPPPRPTALMPAAADPPLRTPDRPPVRPVRRPQRRPVERRPRRRGGLGRRLLVLLVVLLVAVVGFLVWVDTQLNHVAALPASSAGSGSGDGTNWLIVGSDSR